MTRESSFRQALQGATFSFTARPDPVAGDLRMSWGIGMLLLILHHAHGKKGSFQKLQFLAHAVRTFEGRNDVRGLLAGEVRASEISVRVEPWLNRAVSYAHGLGMVKVAKGKAVSLTEVGRRSAELIVADETVFKEERMFLAEVSKGLTEASLARIWRMEDVL